jgi:hypothetical protein
LVTSKDEEYRKEREVESSVNDNVDSGVFFRLEEVQKSSYSAKCDFKFRSAVLRTASVYSFITVTTSKELYGDTTNQLRKQSFHYAV